MSHFWEQWLSEHPTRRFVDVCCGGGAVSVFIGRDHPHIELVSNDIHPAAVALLRGVSQEGWKPPPTLTADEHRLLKAAANAGESSPRVGWAGFGGSYGGQYFAGFACTRGRCHAESTTRTLLRDAPHLARAQFHNLDYAALPDVIGVCDGDVWYIDKPYAGTTGYKGTPKFDEVRFWSWATEMSKRVPVLVSEFAAPEGWEKIWSAKRKLHLKTQRFQVHEDCVFTRRAPR